jgi:hypothetical protein
VTEYQYGISIEAEIEVVRAEDAQATSVEVAEDESGESE